ncbi:TetR/AcrR family transcriptional regulator [Nocardia sp. NEAU-G5]|uniref:TetR/AcrR family transcriptional regulator n=1 Tax=Nocardia albiluteola TaxID=2842303 RepID=A0ABS6AW40_9NOCA|nr:TetR/AcrR family transcriptional regulator [Nocardia albiluteola]MBU3062253.1 TetR/AcrR family transcriptional regulator [Nocardia albiluteola]
MATSATPYHHGDLPNALVRAAVELLEEGGAAELSLRGAARRAGVSTAAPYRHFADRDALLSAVAAVGYRDLAQQLAAVHPQPVTPAGLADVAIEYVRFALRRPGMFRVMFTESCDTSSTERVAAVEAIHEYLESLVREAFPAADPEPTATAMWALVHGLAFLHLDGKLDASSDKVVADQVRAAISAILAVSRSGGR